MKTYKKIIWNILFLGYIYIAGISVIYFFVYQNNPPCAFTPFTQEQRATIHLIGHLLVALFGLCVVMFIVFNFDLKKRFVRWASSLVLLLDLLFCAFYYNATRTIQAEVITRMNEVEIDNIQQYYSLSGEVLPPYFYIEFDFYPFAIVIVSAFMLVIYNIMYRENG